MDRDYFEGDSQQFLDTSYKDGFRSLVKDIDEHVLTGIPTVDDANVNYGNSIEITKGKGEFVNLKSNYNTATKSFTWINSWGKKGSGGKLAGGQLNWAPGTNQYVIAYSKELLSQCVLYKDSGVIKLYDRYILAATGTYWAHAFGQGNPVGQTYRIHLDTGKYYDILVTDTKRTTDAESRNDPSGKFSIAHDKGSNSYCITEFDLLHLCHHLPTVGDSKHPSMDYENIMKVSGEKDYANTGKCNWNKSLNSDPSYKGNVVKVEVIDDVKVKELFEKAKEEVKAYY